MMKVEEARQIAKEKIEALAQELERGQSETLKAYLAAMAKFPQYSVNNTLLIMAQRPDAQHVAGFTMWKRLGRSVRKGEHGIAILAPVVKRRKHADSAGGWQSDEKTQPKDDGLGEVVVGFRGAYVFDISQTEDGV